MAVKRIVTNIAATRVDAARAFYAGLFDLELVMDHEWILTFAATDTAATPQISVASQGGSGTPVLHVSIEVDNLKEVLLRVEAAGWPVEYGPTQEPWGVRRFYLRDPFDRLINVLTHIH